MKTFVNLAIAALSFVFLTPSLVAEAAFKPFRSPEECIKIPLKAGFKPISDKPLLWRETELGWLSHTTIRTHNGQLKKVGDIDNDISCFFSGEKEYIEFVRVTADCFNPDGTAPTITKFREVVELLARDLGIEAPEEILKEIDPAKGKVIDAATYKITVEKVPYKIGYGWVFKLETKEG
ncbi:hypothetical protein [Luteolibacter sp. AS25]|uniref:hypothetical protein n=1 Tax=Luteolibacter sp. AS25 TaxID=3135776 RepID=UPI00398B7CFB